MAVGVVLDILGGTEEQYDTVMRDLGIEGAEALPEGLVVHVAGPTDVGWRMIDVWESREAFDTFLAEGLLFALEAAGLPPAESLFFPVYNLLQRP